MPSPDDDYETIAHFAQPAEAHVLRAHLESQGIPVMLADEHLAALNWFVSSAVGGIRIQVPRSRIADALEVMGAVQAGLCALSNDDGDSATAEAGDDTPAGPD